MLFICYCTAYRKNLEGLPMHKVVKNMVMFLWSKVFAINFCRHCDWKPYYRLSSWQVTLQIHSRTLSCLLPFKGEERNYGRSQEQIILFWKLPNTDSGSGALNSICFREKAGIKLCITANPLIILMQGKPWNGLWDFLHY